MSARLPRTCLVGPVSSGRTDAESSNGRMRRSERRHVGSSPASAASPTEVIRPDEEPVLKTGGGQQPLVGSSPTASAFGVMVQQDDASFARWKSGCDSR
jgi:hypothetical protein